CAFGAFSGAAILSAAIAGAAANAARRARVIRGLIMGSPGRSGQDLSGWRFAAGTCGDTTWSRVYGPGSASAMFADWRAHDVLRSRIVQRSNVRGKMGILRGVTR